MSLELFKLKYLGCAEEAAGAYGISQTGTPANFIPFPYMEGSLKIDGDTQPLDPMLGKVEIDGFDQQVIGPKKCAVSFDTPLHSHGLDLDGDVAPPTTANWALLRLLKIVFGGFVATTNPGVQTTVQAATSTTVVKVNVGHGARFQAGGAIGCQTVVGSSALELKEIAQVVGDDVTVREAFSAIPITGTPVRGCVTVYPTRDPDTTAQFFYQGRELSKNFGFMGCNGGIGLAIALNGLSKLSFNLAGCDWERKADHAGVTSTTYTNVKPIVCVNAPLTVPVFGNTTRVLVHQAAIAMELAIAYADEMSGSGVNGIRRKRRLPGRPLVKGSFTRRFEDQNDFASFEGLERRAIYQQLGVLAGESMLISVPRVQPWQPKEAPNGELDGLQVPWMATNDTLGTTELTSAVTRWHFF